ncbi:unnamed protein product [Adineta ricciae]|uniref:Snake toxin/toxin-like domain-containing protein n=1 Tax=Adineta ricciae TaxID=249248 RepID=A0A813RMX7_ADIRI|nr:unnamed protein product [Adineta ricciae]
MANQVSQILITVLILSVFYIQFGSALICWTCDPCPEPFTNTSTTTSIRAANCSSSNTICVKNTVRIVNRSPQISKGCVSSCTQSGSNSFGVGAFVDCCNTDYYHEVELIEILYDDDDDDKMKKNTNTEQKNVTSMAIISR